MTPEFANSGAPQGVVDELVKLYRDAAARLREEVLHPQGRTQSARDFKAGRAAQQLAQIDRILASLKQNAAGWIGTNLPQVFVDGITRANQQARDAGVLPPDSPIQGSFSLVNEGTVEIFAKDIYHDLGGAADSMGQQAKRVLRETRQQDLDERDVDRILAGGVIEGKPTQAIRQLRDALRAVAGDVVTVIDKNGHPIQFETGYYASMVARTKTRQATVKARHQRLEGLGLDLVSIVGRVSRYFCTAYLGQVFSLSGRSDKYPALASLPSGGPPFHPNCSKSTRPFIEGLASEKQLDDAEGDDDQPQMLNIDTATAQRRYKDLQIEQQVRQRYPTTAAQLNAGVTKPPPGKPPVKPPAVKPPPPPTLPFPLPSAPPPIVAAPSGPAPLPAPVALAPLQSKDELKGYLDRTDTLAAEATRRLRSIADAANQDLLAINVKAEDRKANKAAFEAAWGRRDFDAARRLASAGADLEAEIARLRLSADGRVREAHAALKVAGPTYGPRTGKVSPSLDRDTIDRAHLWLEQRTAARTGLKPRRVDHELCRDGRARQTDMGTYGRVRSAPDTKPQTYVHELGHELEDTLPGAKKLANLFLEHRVGNETPVKLQQLFPNSKYRADEKGRGDDWGKTFGQSKWYVGKTYPDGSTELLSMGLEMLFKDPLHFARQDPEYVRFLVGVLHGEIE